MRCLAAVLACLLPGIALACPGETYCEIDDGRYRLVLPAGEAARVNGAADPVPALLYLHGWGASPEGVVNGRRAMIGAAVARGYAVVLPEGVARAGRTQRDWAVEDGRPHPRDDLAFLAGVLDDAARRGIDRDRVLLSGFSRGGSMVWEAACARPGLVRAYAPVAGAFWAPMPSACAGAVDLYHVHGWADRVVPLEGRPIGTRLMQGDVFRSLATLREVNGCSGRQPDERATEAGRWTRHWTDCEGGRIDLILHPGGHVVPEGWIGPALDWFEARLAEPAD